MKQIAAGRGSRSLKSGQSNFFVGYKKHTVRGALRLEGSWRLIALCSQARRGNQAEPRVIKPLLNYVRRSLREFPLRLVVADQAYLNANLAAHLRRHWQVALIVRPRSNMVAPAGSAADGCPLCPAGERLLWEDYDLEDEALLYIGDPRLCARCPLHGSCARRFEFPAAAHETFWGMTPSHSLLSRELLRRFRPLIEPGFNSDKNRHYLKDFFLNSKELAQQLFILSDCLECLEILAKIRKERGQETRKALIHDLNDLEIWD